MGNYVSCVDGPMVNFGDNQPSEQKQEPPAQQQHPQQQLQLQQSHHHPSQQDSLESFQNSLFQRPTSYAHLPWHILERIFNSVPAEHRLVAAAVCQPWKDTLFELPSCWQGIKFGRFSNRFTILTEHPPIQHANLFLLTLVREIQFCPAIPAVFPDSYESPDIVPSSYYPKRLYDQLQAIPYQWLRLGLTRAPELKRLDLSQFKVGDGDEDAFR